MTTFPSPEDLAADVFEKMSTKASQAPGTIAALGVAAGVYIALGGMVATVALAGTDMMSYGLTQVLSGLVFSLGLAAVLIAGAELFTGNTLFAGAVVSGKLSAGIAGRALLIAYVANLVGSLAMAALAFASGLHEGGEGAVGRAAVELAVTKTDKSDLAVLASGILANLLVCLGVWLSLAAQTVSGKIIGLVLPVTAFVAAGFEHSVANMYLLPHAYLVDQSQSALPLLTLASITGNIIAATIGNLIGGGLLGLTYAYVYRQGN